MNALIWEYTNHCWPPSVDPEIAGGHINNQNFLFFAEYDAKCKAVCGALQPPYLTIQMWASITHKTVYHATWVCRAHKGYPFKSATRCFIPVCVCEWNVVFLWILTDIWIMLNGRTDYRHLAHSRVHKRFVWGDPFMLMIILDEPFDQFCIYWGDGVNSCTVVHNLFTESNCRH